MASTEYSNNPNGRDDQAAAVSVHIAFHGPFRVGTGLSRNGVNEAVDRDDLLPASSLKGLMRASATRLLPARLDLVERVFGRQPPDPDTTTPNPSAGTPLPEGDGSSPWHWTPAALTTTAVTSRARIAVDADSGAARRDYLALNEEVWAGAGEFTVIQTGYLDPNELITHRTVLACAAAGVHALGADRRRGLGWVTCRPQEPPVDDALLARFQQIRQSPPAPQGGRRSA